MNWYRKLNNWAHHNLPKGVDKLLHFVCGCLIVIPIAVFAPHTDNWEAAVILTPAVIGMTKEIFDLNFNAMDFLSWVPAGPFVWFIFY